MWKWVKSRFWDVEAVVWGAPELWGIHYKVPWSRRVSRFLRREYDIAIVVFLLIVMTIVVYRPYGF